MKKLKPVRDWNAVLIRKFLLLSILAVIAANLFNISPVLAKGKDVVQSKEPKVVLVSMPRTTWQSLSLVDTPNIDKLISGGAVASFSVKSASKSPTLESAYASISSGSRAVAVSPSISTFYSASESVGSRNVSDIFKRERGKTPSPSQSVAIGFEKTLIANRSGLSPAWVGSFSGALASKNKTIAVFGNADFCEKMTSSCAQRAIGHIGTTDEGVVSYGDVSRNLLDSGLMINMKRLENVSKKSIFDNDVTAVECSNLEKLEENKKFYSPDQFDAAVAKSISQCDELIGTLMSVLDFKKDRIYVLSPVAPRNKEQLTAFISVGKGITSGYASSGITRREGIVALSDIAPTILTFFDIAPPQTMVTTLIESGSSSDSVAQKYEKLTSMNDKALLRDSSFPLLAATFGLLSFFGILISILAFRKIKRLRPLAKWLVLMSLSFPACTFVISPLMQFFSNPYLMASTLLVMTLLIASMGFYIGEKTNYLFVVLGIASLNILLLVGDVLTGAQLQLNSIFGYSAIDAGRYAGYGNMSFAILSISTVLFVAAVKQIAENGEEYSQTWLNQILLVGLIAILVLDGAPFFGSDVGGVFALTPTVFILSMFLFKKELRIRSIFISVFLTLSAVAVFAVLDLNRPISERTHLGRFVEMLFNGQAGIVIERKLAANLAILTNSTLSSVVIIGTLIGMFVFLHPERFIKGLVSTYPFFKFLVFPGLILGVLGLLLNDSGAAIPGMMLAIALPSSVLVLYDFEPIEQSVQSNTTLDRKGV